MSAVHYQTGGEILQQGKFIRKPVAKFTMLCGFVFNRWDGNKMVSGAFNLRNVTCKSCSKKIAKWGV